MRAGDSDLIEKGRALCREQNIRGLLVTRGELGMILINGEQLLSLPAHSHEVFDVTGAGDTVIASMGCAFAVGSSPADALHLANVAAGIVVGKLGATTATPAEILHELALEEGS